MDKLHNPFKQALKSGRLQLGLWHSLSSPIVAEILADAGFDWILLDTEHAPNELPMVLAELQAMSGGTAHPVVRPAWNDPVIIKRLLDVGAQSLLIPYVETEEEARRAVMSVRYPPDGFRGFAGQARASRYGRIKGYHGAANAQICLLLQVETKRGLDNLEKIASVEGVDGVFIGPGDLSAALGYLGQPNHPEVIKIIDDMIPRIKNAGVRAGDFDRRRRTRPALHRPWLPVRRGRLRHRTAGEGRRSTRGKIQRPESRTVIGRSSRADHGVGRRRVLSQAKPFFWRRPCSQRDGGLTQRREPHARALCFCASPCWRRDIPVTRRTSRCAACTRRPGGRLLPRSPERRPPPRTMERPSAPVRASRSSARRSKASCCRTTSALPRSRIGQAMGRRSSTAIAPLSTSTPIASSRSWTERDRLSGRLIPSV